MWTWLLAFAAALSLFKTFTTLPGLLDGILARVSLAIMLAYIGAHLWKERAKRQAEQG